MSRVIWKGAEAIAEAAIRAGCRAFFGYGNPPKTSKPEQETSKRETANPKPLT